MARPFRNMRNLLIPLLAVSLASCTEEPALHPELVSFDVEPTHNSVTLTARFNHADLITGATFNLMEYGKNTVMHQPAEISGNFLPTSAAINEYLNGLSAEELQELLAKAAQ